ncbi:hypothetical protein DFH06DRAFT_1141827 [Mycena polygramma]|nr:hypothetical protein DFH06DRAFT_1141827 [Mycena polygramma]
MSLPAVGPTGSTLERFWKKVAEVTTRYHDPELGWVGGEDVSRWNDTNTQPCERCANSRNGKKCEVDSDHPSCRACRRNKVGFKPVVSRTDVVHLANRNRQSKSSAGNVATYGATEIESRLALITIRVTYPVAGMARDLEIANRNMRVIYASTWRRSWGKVSNAHGKRCLCKVVVHTLLVNPDAFITKLSAGKNQER